MCGEKSCATKNLSHEYVICCRLQDTQAYNMILKCERRTRPEKQLGDNVLCYSERIRRKMGAWCERQPRRRGRRRKLTRCGNEGIAIHGGGNEAEVYLIEGALASGYIHKYAK
jgi:hypothetical protein